MDTSFKSIMQKWSHTSSCMKYLINSAAKYNKNAKKKVKYTQTIRRQVALELFYECLTILRGWREREKTGRIFPMLLLIVKARSLRKISHKYQDDHTPIDNRQIWPLKKINKNTNCTDFRWTSVNYFQTKT